ncbi:MAG: FHA domain-containing protein [Pirellulaceae bacterium]|nr:FHA domain-containing protein [Pirellulaceae bacterium]
MRVILRAVGGPGEGVQFLIRRGQSARIGRTEWADFSVPGDGAMSDVHFAVECGSQGCRLRAMGPAVTLVNGNPVVEAGLRSGDRVTAGATTFAVQVQGGAEDPAQAATAPAAPSAAAPVVAPAAATEWPAAEEYCRQLELSDEARPLLEPGLPPELYIDRLIAHGLFPDGLRFVGNWLPKPDAVRWACQCVQGVLGQQLTAGEQRAFDAALCWAAEPSEENRRHAETAAEKNQFNGPASWLALGAFWSEGSLAPANLPEALPPEGLAAQALAAALVLAAARVDPRRINARCHEFLLQGRELALSLRGATA